MSVQLLSSASDAGFHARTTGWESSAPGLPSLRGRRAEGPGPTIHFLSGNGFCAGVYWPFLRGLLAGHGLFSHDIEGHGASDAPAKFSGINAVCRRVIAAIAEQKLKTPLIGMGHSFGGALTVKLAAQNPGLFRALVLLDPILMPPGVWHVWSRLRWLRANPMAQGSRKRRDRWLSREAVAEHLRGRGIYAGWAEEAFDSFIEHATREDAGGERILCCPRELEAQIFERPVYPWDALRKISVPVLYLHGASSYDFFPASARRAQKLNPQIRVQTLPGGHCFMQENPAAATQAVRDFLAASASEQKPAT